MNSHFQRLILKVALIFGLLFGFVSFVRADSIPLSVWIAEEKIAEPYAASHHGLLPDTAFWDMVTTHFEQALDTGHKARFEYYHGPLVTEQEETNINAYIPPVISPPVISPPVISPPVCHEGPSPPPHGGAVPEPSSLSIMSIGMVLLWLFWLFKRN